MKLKQNKSEWYNLKETNRNETKNCNEMELNKTKNQLWLNKSENTFMKWNFKPLMWQLVSFLSHALTRNFQKLYNNVNNWCTFLYDRF